MPKFPMTAETASLWLKEHGSELVGEFETASKRVWLVCALCKNVFSYKSFSSLKRLNPACRCKGCFRDNLKVSKEEVVGWLGERGAVLVGDYPGFRKPIVIRCSCGKEDTYSSFHSLRGQNKSARCRTCNGKKKDPNAAKNFFLSRGQVLISEEGSLIRFQCCKCGGDATISNIYNIQRVEREKGSYHFQCESCYSETFRNNLVRARSVSQKRELLEGGEKAKEWFLERGSTLVSTYLGSNNPVSFLCSQCGKETSYVSFDIVTRKNQKCWCKECVDIEKRKKHSELLRSRSIYTPEVVREKLQKIGSDLIEFDRDTKSIKAICCGCGGVAKKKDATPFVLGRKKSILCKSCLQDKVLEIIKVPESEIKEWFDKNGIGLIRSNGNLKRIYFKCKKCGQEGSYNSFCLMKKHNSRGLCGKCSVEARSGERSPNYNPELTAEDRMKGRFESDYVVWARAVYRAHRGYCAITGKSIRYGHRHHLFAYSGFRFLRHKVWNGVYLRKELHRQFHGKYGRGQNTYFEFKDFYQELTGREFFLYNRDSVIVDILKDGTSVEEIRKKKQRFESCGFEYNWFLEHQLHQPEVIEYLDKLFSK